MGISQKVFLVITLVLTASRVMAAPSGASTLQAIVSGRAAGMAEAFSTVTDDITAVTYNPGVLGTLATPQISGTLSRGLASEALSIMSYGHPTRLGTFAGSFAYYDAGKEELSASDGSVFNVHLQRDVLGGLSYANHIGMLNLGASGKFLRSELAEAASAATFAGDIGGLVRFSDSRLATGIALRNLGPGLKFIDQRDSLPTELRFGGSYVMPVEDTARSGVLLSVDVPYLMVDDIWTANVGLEYMWQGLFSFQTGYRFNSDAETLSLGFGIKWKGIIFNYGFGLAGSLSDTHRITVGHRFGSSQPTKNAEEKKNKSLFFQW